jgi:RNA-binding protein
MALSQTQFRYLRGLTHALKPVILVGAKGVTTQVLAELDGALEHHELVKVRLASEDREQRASMIEQLATHTKAELVQKVGKVLCLYRRNAEKPKLALPR